MAAPGGGELAYEVDAPAAGDDEETIDSSTVGPGGAATADHRVLYCPQGSSAPLRDLWYVFSDRDVVGGGAACWPGSSDSWTWTVEDRMPDARCVVGWTGQTTSDFKAPFAGIGAELANGDLSAYSGVALRVRGDGTRMRFELSFKDQLGSELRSDCEDDDLDLYGSALRCGDGSDQWQALTLPFSKMQQQGWGTKTSPDWTRVDKVQLRVLDSPLKVDPSRPARHPDRTIGGVRTDGFDCDFEVVGFIPR